MGIIIRIVNWVVGNGYDLSEDEDVAEKHRKKAKDCLETSQTHFSIMKKKFEKMPTPDPEGDDSKALSDTHQCFDL